MNAAGDTPASAPLEDALYRVVQEALNNVIKHAGASRVEVSIIESVTTDRPTGRRRRRRHRRARTSAGFGLIGMRERVELMGGTLAVGPGRGGGTELRASLPVTRASEPALAAGSGDPIAGLPALPDSRRPAR